jgi:hypothetical protein
VAPPTDGISTDGGQFARWPVRQRPQCQQLLAGRGSGQRGHRPFAPEKPQPQKKPRHVREKDRRRHDGHRQQYGQPTGRGIQVVDGGRDVGGGLAGRVKRLADGIADYRNMLCSMARRRQVACDTVRAALDLPAGLGNRRDGVVNGGSDNYPYRRPHGDGEIAE